MCKLNGAISSCPSGFNSELTVLIWVISRRQRTQDFVNTGHFKKLGQKSFHLCKKTVCSNFATAWMSLANAMIRQPTSAIAWANMTPLIQKCFFLFRFLKNEYFLVFGWGIRDPTTQNYKFILFQCVSYSCRRTRRHTPNHSKITAKEFFWSPPPKKKRKKKPAAGPWRKTIEIQRNPQCLRATKILTRTNKLLP